jgi:hypothetical protein
MGNKNTSKQNTADAEAQTLEVQFSESNTENTDHSKEECELRHPVHAGNPIQHD